MRFLLKCLLILGLVWLAGFVWFLLALPGPAAPDLKTDGIVVLTGGPGRVARGVELIDAKAADRLLISGTAKVVTKADLAKEVGAEIGLFECCIDLGKYAENTQGNGAEIARWASENGYETLRVVTAADHMRRALVEVGSRLPPGVKVLPDAVPANMSPSSLLKEYSKFLASQFNWVWSDR